MSGVINAMDAKDTLALIEWFCGIGGVAEAAGQMVSVRGRMRIKPHRAIDINRHCGTVYRYNFQSAVDCHTIESIDLTAISNECGVRAVWWLSPPCQPYCRRGLGQYESDRRCDGLLAMVKWFGLQPSNLPEYVVLENVPEFARSAHADFLREVLTRCGYRITEKVLCPTQLGIPNRRCRYYLIAARGKDARMDWPAEAPRQFAVSEILDPMPDPKSPLWLTAELESQYATALDIIESENPAAVTACFASSYGKSIIRSGSYLRQQARLRRFSPAEVSRLLGFSAAFAFPPAFSNRIRWKMLGNSLSIPVVKRILEAITA